MFNIGDRVSRDFAFSRSTLARNGNILSVDKAARVAFVVFDNHTETAAVPCTFESMRLIGRDNTSDALHPAAEAARQWGKVKKRTNTTGTSGDRVLYLCPPDVPGNPSTGVREGYIQGMESNGYRHVVDSVTGELYNMSPDDVRQWFEI